MANISNVINVQLLQGGRLASRDNLNVVSIITSELGFLSSNKRYEVYRDLASVATDFGTYSKAYDFAKSFFGTSPNPISSNGYLIMGYWRAADETVAASAATIKGAELSEATVIGQVQTISDGSFDIDVDGLTVNVTGLDFRVVTSLTDIVTLLDTAITGATVTLDNIGIVITSDTTGATSLLTLPVAAATGTFVGDILGLAAGTGAVLTQGADASVLTAETKEAAITEIKAETNAYGYMFIDQPTSAEATTLGAWAQANNSLVYDVFSSAANLEIDVTNVVWSNVLAGYTNYRMMYSAANNRKMAASYMARAHVVNFDGENTALTMHLKELSIPAETYTEGEILKAKNVGLDLYTTIKNTPVILTSGANDFMDNRYNLIGFVDSIQTDMFNLYKSTATKIPQTQRGINIQLDQLEKTTQGFVRADVFGPGTWSSPDSFGDLETFKRSILTKGYYWLAGSLADQSQASREARDSVVFQGAVKLSGAVHKGFIIINVNK